MWSPRKMEHKYGSRASYLFECQWADNLVETFGIDYSSCFAHEVAKGEGHFCQFFFFCSSHCLLFLSQIVKVRGFGEGGGLVSGRGEGTFGG